MPLIKESDVTILVRDMDKAIAFYLSLGLTLQNRWGNHYARVVTTGITLGLHPANDVPTTGSGSVSVGFMVDDINEAKTLLEQHQIAFDYRDGKSGKFLNFNDLDGTVLYFMQPGY